MPMPSRLQRAIFNNGPALLVLTTLFWAGNMIVGRWIAGQVPPVTLAFLRWLGASLLILPLAWRHLRQDGHVIRAHLPVLIVLGITGSGLFNTLQYAALVTTTTTSAGVIYAFGPIMILLMSALLNGERIRGAQVAAVAISLAGVAIILTHGAPQDLAATVINRGDVIMLIAVAVWAFYTAYLTRRPALHPLTFAAITFFVAAILNLPLSAIELTQGAPFILSPKTALAILYTAVFPSLLAYLFYNRGVELLGPSKAGAYMNLVPLFAAALGLLILGEQPHLYHFVGFALILGGVAIVTRTRAPSATLPQK